MAITSAQAACSLPINCGRSQRPTRTDLINNRLAAEAMPLDQPIAQTMAVLGTDADEILVEGARAFRSNAGPQKHGLVNSFNEYASARFASG